MVRSHLDRLARWSCVAALFVLGPDAVAAELVEPSTFQALSTRVRPHAPAWLADSLEPQVTPGDEVEWRTFQPVWSRCKAEVCPERQAWHGTVRLIEADEERQVQVAEVRCASRGYYRTVRFEDGRAAIEDVPYGWCRMRLHEASWSSQWIHFGGGEDLTCALREGLRKMTCEL